MKTFLTAFLLLLTGALWAFEVDSVKRREMVREGQQELCQLLEHNARVTDPSEKQFVVVINGEPAQTYVKQQHVDTLHSQILSQECVDSLNAKLKRTYRDYHIEMYVVVLKTFNLIVHSPLPANISGQSLFNTQLYDAQSNIAQLRAQHSSITDEIIQNTFSARNQDCIVYSRAEYSGSLVPGKVRSWTFSKRVLHRANPRTYNQLDNLASYFADRIINNTNVTQSGLEYSLKAVADEFNEAAKFCALRAQILTTYTSSGMSAIFAQFNGNGDYKSLTVEERIHALGVFAGYTMNHNLITKEEYYAIEIIRNTPPFQAPEFLAQLSLASPLLNNPNYAGDKENKALIVCLIEEIDDAVIGQDGNNYAGLVRALTSVTLSNEYYVDQHLPKSDLDWVNRTIYWDDQYILQSPPVGTHNYNVTLQSNSQIELQKSVVKRLDPNPDPEALSAYVPVWDNTYSQLTLSPFDIVVIYNRSSLGMIQVAGAAQDQPYLGPAIMLKYCDDKEFNQQAVTGAAILLSTVAILSGPAAILTAVEAGNVGLAIFEGVQFVGAYMDLQVNVGAPAEFQNAVATFNLIVGVWGVTRIAVSAGQYTADILSGVRSGNISPIEMSTAQQYCNQCDLVNWDNVSPQMKGPMKRMDELLGAQVASGSILATTQFSRTAINNLVGFEDNITSLATARNLSLSEFIALEAKTAADMTEAELETINSIRNSIPVPTSNTVMQKVIPKIHIDEYLQGNRTFVGGFVTTAEDAKHLQTFDDIFYGLRLDYDNTKFLLSDGSCGVIRFKATNSNTVTIPKSLANNGNIADPAPFTGHGFTSGNNGRLGAPEWKFPAGANLDDGSELWEVYSDGHEVLRGKYDAELGKFVSVTQ